MNSLELLIIVAIVLVLVIWFLKSKRFARFLDWLTGTAPKDADQISNSAAALDKERTVLVKKTAQRKQELEEEHKKIENIKL